MKVLLITESPNRNRCTYTALTEIEMEIIHLRNKDIRGCIACRKCKTDSKYIFNDFVNEIAPKFAECDGIVMGTAVYFASANGGLISFIDCLFYSARSN